MILYKPFKPKNKIEHETTLKSEGLTESITELCCIRASALFLSGQKNGSKYGP